MFTDHEKDLVRAVASIPAPPAWMPVEYTKPLSEDFPSDGHRLIRFADEMYTFEDSDDYKLYEWQRWLIVHVLEKYPKDHPDPFKAGNLRYRQCLVEIARQNGKSEVGAIFSLYGYLLQKKRGAQVLILASDVDQAHIAFGKIAHAVENNPALNRMHKTTHFRGIYSRDKANKAGLKVKSGNGKGLQGQGINFCLFDEVHISREDAWDAMVVGMTAEPNAMILGITTAGDDNSHLLKRLLKTGRQAINQEEGYDERFGCFLWYSPEHLDMYDPDGLKMANPTLAEGHRSLEMDLNTIKNLPPTEVRRYKLNRMVSSENVWLQVSMWMELGKGGIPLDYTGPVCFSIERSIDWTYATIVASCKIDDKVYTEVVKSYVNPHLKWLEEDCVTLFNTHNVNNFYMDSHVLKDLAESLREKGYPVEYLTSNQMMNATATAYQMIAKKRVVHDGFATVQRQIPKTVTENVGDGMKVSRRKSAPSDVDAVIATVIAIWAAETMEGGGPSIYVIPKRA